MKLPIRTRLLLALAFCLVAFNVSAAQTYTDNELVAAAPLAWQAHHDPAGRLTIGEDDGNAVASGHASEYAVVIRYGGSNGLDGLLSDFTTPTVGTAHAFGFAPSGCAVTDEPTMLNCMRIRWERAVLFTGQPVMHAVLSFKTNTVSHTEFGVKAGDAFSIERVGRGVGSTVNFYRSTSVPGERRRVFSFASPYAASDPDTPFDTLAVFAPGATVRAVKDAQERYYCCI